MTRDQLIERRKSLKRIIAMYDRGGRTKTAACGKRLVDTAEIDRASVEESLRYVEMSLERGLRGVSP